MSKGNKKKLGYSQYEELLADSHKKLDILANRFHEMQTYFVAYIEYKGDNIEFGDWMAKKIKEIKEIKDDTRKDERVNEPHLEGSAVHQR